MIADSNARIFPEAASARADSVSNMIPRLRRADRTRYKLLGELRPVFERDSRQDADAIAIHRTKVRRQSESPVRRREQTVAVAASPHWQRHLENNAPAADRSLTAKKSCHHRETRDSETHPISAHTATPHQSEFLRPSVLPSVVWAALMTFVSA